MDLDQQVARQKRTTVRPCVTNVEAELLVSLEYNCNGQPVSVLQITRINKAYVAA